MILSNKNSRFGFSLIELSVAILVIGILVIGITQGSRIIRSAKLISAQALTVSSPVSSMTNLVMWLETTKDKSINDSDKIDGGNGGNGTVSNWYDNNTQTTPNNATQLGAATLKPTFIASGINGLPVLRFDGNSDFMSFDGTKLANKDYTIFVVEQRRAVVAGGLFFIAGSGGGVQNQMLHLGYRSDNLMAFAQWGNDCDAIISGYKSPIPALHTFRFSSYQGKNYYANGVNMAFNSQCPSPNTGLSSYVGAQIGRFNTLTHYNGDIAEIIMFNRAVTALERNSVESYLRRKWGI
jgi:prepilin-type N-terminal cleavage/methylation domain-containing protein